MDLGKKLNNLHIYYHLIPQDWKSEKKTTSKLESLGRPRSQPWQLLSWYKVLGLTDTSRSKIEHVVQLFEFGIKFVLQTWACLLGRHLRVKYYRTLEIPYLGIKFQLMMSSIQQHKNHKILILKNGSRGFGTRCRSHKRPKNKP